MKAVHYEGVHRVSISESPKPKLPSPTDAILRVTTSGICGSDLHMYDGRTQLEKGTIIGTRSRPHRQRVCQAQQDHQPPYPH